MNNEPDYDNLFFEGKKMTRKNKMTDCKNCKYTDEYCASGDCTAQNDLTEQYKHGNLPDDRLYYYRFKGEPEVQITTQYGLYCEEAYNKKEIEVIDFVPSYEELQNMNEAVNECMAANIKLVEQNKQLKERVSKLEKMQYSYTPEEWNTMLRTVNRTKELLKECFEYIDWTDGTGSPISQQKLLDKIDEALKCGNIK